MWQNTLSIEIPLIVSDEHEILDLPFGRADSQEKYR